MAHRLTRLAALPVLAVLLFVAASALAQTDMANIADPTRPPAGFLVGEANAEAAEAVTGPVLQSVLIPKKGRAVALIGGQQVYLGEMYGESRLIKLSEREAVLEGPGGVERLMLTPGVEKTNIVMKKLNRSPAPRRAQSEGKP